MMRRTSSGGSGPRRLIRPPSDDELKLVVGFYQKQRARLGDKAGDLAALAGDDEIVERAAWTATARAVLNLDEMVTKD